MAIALGLKMKMGSVTALIAAVLTTGLQAWHKFTATTWSGANRLPDSSPVATNTAALFTGRGLSFDGVNDVVTVGATGVTVKTVVFLAYPDTTTQSFMQLQASGAVRIQIAAGTLSATGFTSPTLYVNGAASSTVAATAWQQIAVTSATGVSASNVLFGQQTSTFLAGRLANVKFFSTELSGAQIAELYANPEQGLPTGSVDADRVGWWQMSAGTGSVDYDASVNSNAGVISGATPVTAQPSPTPQWSLGSLSRPMYFDGTDDRVQSTTGLGPLANAWTVSLWFTKPTTGSTTMFAARTSATDAIRITMQSGTEIRASNTGSVLSQRSASGFVVNKLYHVVVICNGTTDTDISIYRDASSVANGINTTAAPTVNGWSIGTTNATGSTGLFTGLLFDVAVWNTALTAGNVTSLFNGTAPTDISAANLKGFWKNPGNQDSDWLDLSGNGKHGTVSGTPAIALLPPGHLSGRDVLGLPLGRVSSNQLILSGSAYASIADAASLDITSAITLEAWVKPFLVNAQQTIVGKNSSYHLSITSAAKLQFSRWSGAANASVASSASLAVNVWAHVAATYNGTTTKLYINGVEDTSSGAVTGAIDATATAVLLGALTTATNLFAGYLDSVKVYNAVLTADQIATNRAAELSSYS